MISISRTWFGAVILAASHLAIHTWPERAQVTLDIYLCEFEAGSVERAEAVFTHITGLFRPRRVETQRLLRGAGEHTEHLPGNADAENQNADLK